MKKLSKEIQEKLQQFVESPYYKAQIKEIDGAVDTGTFKVVITSSDTDRHGDIVLQEGLDIGNYMLNPVVLAGHGQSFSKNINIVGVTDKLFMEVKGDKKQWIAEGRFAPTQDGQALRKLYDAGMLHATSIGFMAKEWEGNVITRSELLEFSWVDVPANPKAVVSLVGEKMFKSLEGLGFKFKDADEEEDEEPKDDEIDEIEKEEEPETPETPEVPKAEETEEEPDEETPEEEEEKSMEERLSNIESMLKTLTDKKEVEEPESNDEEDEEEPEEEDGEKAFDLHKAMQDIATYMGDALHKAKKERE
ncbi:MAG: HK97 family phage prohead protease [Candidatus Peribacteraceae bacterium]|nr:HK97 family phage prohead protease [Candidatus Peribacteraceae bacterium]